jgi:hypothetical protein
MHIGEKIKARAKELRVGATELSHLIKTSKQNIYSIYQRKTVDTGLLQKLSKALEYDFFAYYGPTGSLLANTPPVEYHKGNKPFITEEDLALVKKDLNELREKYELLKALYEAKTGKKVPGSLH